MISYLAELYVLNLLLLSTEASAFTRCQKSILTVKYGNHCPKDAASWQMAADRMNCNFIRQQCSESLGLDHKRYIFQYHCLINSWMNATIEFCALNRSILGYCAEFDTDGAFIQENYRADCRKFDPPCPRIYNSAEAYKYQSCYYSVYRHYNWSVQPSQEPHTSCQLRDNCCAGYMLNNAICVQCPVGYFGLYCNEPCPYPLYGNFCLLVCSCEIMECHHITGCSFKKIPGISQQKTTLKQGFVLSRNPLHNAISSGFTTNITGLREIK